jgi:hypothetical protein
MTKYDNVNTCNSCGGKNKLSNESYLDRIQLLECDCTCQECGFFDYWSYGFFASREDGFDQCDTYSNK